ncbi:MAG TPA: hypothetical protein PK771_02655 [Spirochaetota bacterium]|nr:hypothetical protein [Spirochaetota bacterium]
MIKIENDKIDYSIYNRVTLYRNIENYPFCKILDNDKRKRLEEEVINFALDSFKETKIIHSKTMDFYEKNLLIEKGIATKSFLDATNSKIINFPKEDLYILLNNNNHLQFVISNENSLKSQYKIVSNTEDIFSKKFKFYFSHKYGFLTQNIKNAGLGLKLSILVHIPGLIFNNKDNVLFKDLGKKGYYLRLWKNLKENNFYYIITSRLNYGLSEEKLIERFNTGIEKLIEMDKRYFNDYYLNHKENIDDIIHKSFGILKYSKKIGYEDSLYLISNLLFASSVNLNLDIKNDNLKSVINRLNDGYIKINYKKNEEDIEKERANIVKDNLFME